MSRTPAVKKGAELQQEIADTTLDRGQIAMWWLGQATCCFKMGETIIYFDPFYRDEDQPPPTLQEMPLRPEEMTGATLICCSHDHLDHVDPETLPGTAAASPEAAVLLPAFAREQVLEYGVSADQIQPMRGDDTFTKAGILVTVLPAAHMDLEYHEETGYRFLGYVFQGHGVTLYHPGDCQPYEGWSERLRRFSLDVACLPINGNDNLHHTQSVYFCADHRPGVAVPIHYGMFSGNTEDPAKFTDLLAQNVPNQTVQVLKVGERFIYSA